MSDPKADNTTAAGRQENRRVQLVVSGSSIGVQQSAPTATDQPAATPPSGTSNPQ
jgi:hypothetical protein